VFAAIVVGTDGSDTAGEAVRQAVELARTAAARLHVVTAYEPVSSAPVRSDAWHAPSHAEWALRRRDDVEAMLEAAAAIAREAGVGVAVYARQGDPADAVLDVAEEQHADLIVVGHKGTTGAKRFLLGTVPNRVSHHAPCSVLIVRTR